MKVLKEAYETIDEKIFKDKEEAEKHENILLTEKELSQLVKRWGDYYWSSEQIQMVCKKVIDDRDKLIELLGGF